MSAQAIDRPSPRPLFNHTVLGLAMLLGLLLIAALAVAPAFPRGVTPASAPSAEFSAERAQTHLPAIASAPHPAGSQAQAAVRDYLVRQLSALGLETEVQRAGPAQNVVARLRGSASTGAIVVLAHYDSVAAGPGAADNGTGVAALLEIMRALNAGFPPRNDVIALFDDAEELGFIGTLAFIEQHPWMDGVQVAISLDTAVKGPIQVNKAGSPTARLVQALAQAHRGSWNWSSAGGDGTYDASMFSQAGIQALALEDNYAFWQQHTTLDQAEIVRPASLQQLGEQALAVTRALGQLDLREPWGDTETFFVVPLLGLVHYPQTWSLPLAVAATLLLVAAIAFALRRRIATWLGLGAGLAAVVGTLLVNWLIVGALRPRVPSLLSWETWTWPMWPEVVPPTGVFVLAAFGLLGLVLALGAYWLGRRVGRPGDQALAGLVPFAVLALLFASTEPRMAFAPLWPVLVAAIGWLLVLALVKDRAWAGDLATWLAAAVLLLVFPALLVGMYQGTGLNEVALLAVVWVLLVLAVMPAVEAALARLRAVARPAA